MPHLSVIELGGVDGLVMTNAFVALAESVNRGERGDTLVICHPSAPFANAGVHQEVEREISLEYCRRRGIQVVRRVIGGGAIADGPWEEDYFHITPLDSDITRGSIQDYYVRMLEPVRRALLRLGVRAERQGLNDLAVGGRKISANGAVDIEGARVLTGDVLMDLNVDMMSSILRVPDEKFRDKVAGSMAGYLTSIREQTGAEADRARVAEALAAEFSYDYGGMERSSLSSAERERVDELVEERGRDDWIFERREMHRAIGDVERRIVKIREGMFLCRHDWKGQKLVRVTVLVDNGVISDITISGDFFSLPVEWRISRLEDALKGVRAAKRDVENAAAALLRGDGVTMIGASARDIATAVAEALEHPIVVPAG